MFAMTIYVPNPTYQDARWKKVQASTGQPGGYVCSVCGGYLLAIDATFSMLRWCDCQKEKAKP